jgi:hypothetical protein
MTGDKNPMYGMYGDKNPAWRGGTYVRGDGYITKSKKLLHRIIVERVLGRKLKSGEIVHHINCDKSDNRNENLLVCRCGYHRALHEKMGEAWAKMIFGRREYQVD